MPKVASVAQFPASPENGGAALANAGEDSYAKSVESFYQQKWKGRVWPAGTYPCKNFPQIQMKPDFGIAFSGGGLRAASLGVGWLRGLAKSGLLLKARYFSVNSGGLWVMEPLMLQTILETESIVKDRGLSATALDKIFSDTIFRIADTKVRKALTQNFGHNFVEGIAENILLQQRINAWSKAVNEIFESVTGTKPVHYTDIHKWPMEASRLPLPIINGTLIVESSHGKHVHIAPFEFTSSYCGVPFDPRTIHESFGNNGGFVHPSVFSTDYGATGCNRYVTQSESGHDVMRMVETYPQSKPFSLSDVSSVSSNAIMWTYLQETKNKLEIGTRFLKSTIQIQQHYWACNPDGTQLEGGDAVLVDGAGSDNTSVIALLRRKVANIMAFDATHGDFLEDDQVYYENNFTSFLSLFGLLTEKCEGVLDYQVYNRQRKVFRGPAWNELLEALKIKRALGKALVYTFPALEVVANPCCGVEPYTVHITFVFNGIARQCPRVEWDELNTFDKQVAATVTPVGLVLAHPLGPDFPCVATEVLHYSQKLVDRMADLAEWSIAEGSGSMLDDLACRLDESLSGR